MSQAVENTITAEEIVALAKGTKALSEEQVARIEELVPDLGKEELMELKKQVEELRDADIKRMEVELETWGEVEAKIAGDEAAKSREKREKTENAAKTADEEYAKNLLNEM